MSRFFYIKVGLSTHWGYSFKRTLFSKTRDSYLLPPPTALIGALAYGLARVKDISEEILSNGGWISSSNIVRDFIRSVNIKVNAPLHHHSDLAKIWWYRARERRVKFDAVATGKVYIPAINNLPSIEAIYVIDELKLRDIRKEDLLLAAYSIVRLGSKESLTSVMSVSYGEAKELSEREVTTSYSFWYDLVESIDGDVITQYVVDPNQNIIGDYARAKYRQLVYPYSRSLKKLSEVKVKVNDKAKVLNIDGEVIIIE